MIRLHNCLQRTALVKLLAVCFFIVLALLITQTLLNVKDVNDSWILEGLFPTFVAFTVIYVTAASFSSGSKLVAVLTSIYVGTLNLLPQLKYVFIYGYYDSLYHYAFARDLTTSGNVPNVGAYAAQYGTTPGSHISIATLSTVTGLSPLLAMKLFSSVAPFLIPLVIYFVTKKLKIPVNLSKSIMLVTAVTSPVLYRFAGTVAVFPLYVLLILCFLLSVSLSDHSRSDFVVTTVFGIGVVISHDVTSFFLVACMALLLSLHLLASRRASNASFLRKSILLSSAGVLVLIILTHFTSGSNVNFPYLIRLVLDSITAVGAGKTPKIGEYYAGFFELTFLQRIVVLAVRYGRDLIAVFLSVLAPLAVYRLRLENNSLRRFYYALTIPTFLCLFALILPLFIRSNFVARGLFYLAAFSPFLAGVTFYWVVRSKYVKFKNAFSALVAFSLIIISIVQFYPCQPLVPKVSTNQTSLYVMDLRTITTIYARSTVYFLSTYDKRLMIATDGIMRSQIGGLTAPEFYKLVAFDIVSPAQVEKAQLLVVVVHEDGHIFPSGRAAVDYLEYVYNLTQKNGIIYTNSKSYVLLKPGS